MNEISFYFCFPLLLHIDIYEALKAVLFNDNAVAGEAAAIAMGSVMLASASEKVVEEMLAYAHDTQHEKIIRGLSLGIALVMCAREEVADPVIDQLLSDQVQCSSPCRILPFLVEI